MKARLIVILIAFASTCVSAEPSAPIRYLMNTPVTLMDWGMYRLERELAQSHPDYHLSLSYYSDENKLWVEVVSRGIIKKDENAARAECKLAVTRVKNSLGGVNPHTGKKPQPKFSALTYAFHHAAFERRDRPKNTDQEIENIAIIKGTIYLERDATSKPRWPPQIPPPVATPNSSTLAAGRGDFIRANRVWQLESVAV